MSADDNKAPAEAGGEGRQKEDSTRDRICKEYGNVEALGINDVKPSPENDDIYGKISSETDSKIMELVDSIRERGLGEPILISLDNYIVSGHRRYYALKFLGREVVPCRRLHVVREGHKSWERLLKDYNPQRIKGVDALLKEAMLTESPEDTAKLMQRHREKENERIQQNDLMEVESVKTAGVISERRRELLEAVKEVVERMGDFLPLSIRQIHYQLLNIKPLVNVPKRGTHDPEKHRYRNDDKSYQALVRLCKDARYAGELGMYCIDDPTRPQLVLRGFTDVNRFIHQEIDGFLCGYHRHLSGSQPHHVEVFGEKNTLRGILEPVCREYYVPLTLGRGFCSIPVWRDMEKRWRTSNKEKMVLLIVSDFDPEGLELADDTVRSLRDLHGVNIDAIRVGITEEQIIILPKNWTNGLDGVSAAQLIQ